ncbi:MAG: hypothetical protein JWO30_4609 [Fibrobacteres bacterium]|nr:hypothetical protein [Fibrobacterota bacterium]
MEKLLLTALCVLGLSGIGHAQTDIYTPYKNKDLWTADTLYIGAGFARLDYKPVKIWLVGNEAALDGELYYVDPTTGKEYFLFGNHEAPGRVVNVTDLVNVPLGVTLTFVYKVVGLGGWSKGEDHMGELSQPKYTGPNKKGSKYYSPTSSDDNNNESRRFGHRWSVAGRINKDVLEFGFEDDSTPTSDMDFDDIVYGVDGLTLVNFQRTAKVRSYIW